MLTQKNYLLVEEQYHCDICSEAVTNPLCPFCLTGELEAWLTLYPNLKSELMPKFKKYLKRIEEKIEDSTSCIKCRNKRASICPYCFTDYVFGELKKLRISKIVFKEFLQFFNYDAEVPNPHAAKWTRLPGIVS
tara:strand:+ start:77 stop:478 length:402 start_codon:yes stop_codon:yes gene_type:complete